MVTLTLHSVSLFVMLKGQADPEDPEDLAAATARLERALMDHPLVEDELLDAAATAELPLMELAVLMPDEDDIDPAILIEALASFAPSELAGWWSNEISLRLAALDDDQAARLRTSLTDESS